MSKFTTSSLICLILLSSAFAQFSQIPVELKYSKILNISKMHTVSFDHGENWQEIAIPRQSHILGAFFFNPDTGYVFGAGGACYSTNDHGLSMMERSAFVDNNLHGGAFKDGHTGLLCGSDGIIVKTADGGASWSIVNELLGITLFSIAYVDSENLICVGQEGVILRSEDSGETWTRVNVSQMVLNANLYRIDTRDPGRLLVTGAGGTALQSETRGESWRKVDDIIEHIENQEDNNKDQKETLSQRFLAEIKAALGTPYVAFCLGEGKSGLFDRDPRCDFSRVDCVTLVEQSLAKALSNRNSGVLENLDHIRYKGGRVGFLSRNHFFAAEWIQANSWILEDVTGNIGGEAVEHLTRTVDRQKFLKLVVPDAKIPEYGNLENYTISYIPKSAIPSVLETINEPMIVSFIGDAPNWLFSSHVGVIAKEESGDVALYHASSDKKKVIAVDFSNYLQQNSRIIGIKVIKLSDDIHN